MRKLTTINGVLPLLVIPNLDRLRIKNMGNFTRYRFINELTGAVLYLMNIQDDIDHESRIDRKKNDLAHKKEIDYSDIICEKLP